MNTFLQAVSIGIASFISTNIDQIIVLILLFSDKKYNPRQIIVGQLLGMTSILLISWLIAWVVLWEMSEQMLSSVYLRGLGVIPITIAIYRAIEYLRHSKSDSEQREFRSSGIRQALSWNTFAIAFLTLSSGGDNIAINLSLFANARPSFTLTYCCVHLILSAILCCVAALISTQSLIKAAIVKYSTPVLCIVLTTLGIYILLGN